MKRMCVALAILLGLSLITNVVLLEKYVDKRNSYTHLKDMLDESWVRK